MLKINNVKKPNGFKVLVPTNPVNVKPRNLPVHNETCMVGNNCPPINYCCSYDKRKPGF